MAYAGLRFHAGRSARFGDSPVDGQRQQEGIRTLYEASLEADPDSCSGSTTIHYAVFISVSPTRAAPRGRSSTLRRCSSALCLLTSSIPTIGSPLRKGIGVVLGFSAVIFVNLDAISTFLPDSGRRVHLCHSSALLKREGIQNMSQRGGSGLLTALQLGIGGLFCSQSALSWERFSNQRFQRVYVDALSAPQSLRSSPSRPAC